MNALSTAESLYAILGLPERSATPEEIKRAYRKAAKSAHPDAGGSPEKFARIQHAYSVLSDPQRRARYDATGDAGETQPDNSLAKIHSIIMGALDRAMQSSDVDHKDIVGAAVRILTEDRDAGKQANRQLEGTKKKLERVRKRLRFKGDGVDLIDRTLGERIADIASNIAANKTIMAQVDEAADKLRNGWDYEVDVRSQADPWTTVGFASFTDRPHRRGGFIDIDFGT